MKMKTGKEVRSNCRSGSFVGQTAGLAPGFAQANLCILPKEYAFDFLLFCQRNPKPCPLLHVLCDGDAIFGDDINIKSDFPKYRVYENGVLVSEPTDLHSVWRDDFVTFVIGCSFSFEEAMINSGIPVRHVEAGTNVPMYNTSIPCAGAGVFKGNMVVSMRPLTPANAVKAVEITGRYPRVHGAPIHIGNPSDIGISNIDSPDYGDPVTILPGELPVFWACGVTPQAVVMQSKPFICITHAPGHMLVLDTRNEELSLS